MKKKYLIAVSIVCYLLILLSGCITPESTQYVYDDSPTVLNITIKRGGVGVRTLSTDSDDFVRLRIWKENEDGDTIYDANEIIPTCDIIGDGYTITKQVPSTKGYSILGVYSDKRGIFEVALSADVNVPADSITTEDIILVPVDYTVVIPEEMFSGGSLSQFKVIFPPEYEHLFEYGVHYRSSPWGKNGDIYETDYSPSQQPKNLGRFSMPTDMHYQLVIDIKERYVNYPPALRTYLPDISQEGVELPTFKVYPNPNWEPENGEG